VYSATLAGTLLAAVKTGTSHKGHSNMNYKVSFQEMERLGMEKLSKQSPTTLEEKRKQFQDLKKQSSSKSRKRRS
jgi:hypothetical protein